MKNILKICFVILGTLVGAGFASGQEMIIFFNRYGDKGIIGVTLSSVLTALVIYSTFKITDKLNINNYKEFSENIINKKSSKILNIIVNSFSLITFYIMIAGIATYFTQEAKIDFLISRIIAVSICFIIYMFSLKGVFLVNDIMSPILILGIIYISFQDFSNVNIFLGTYAPGEYLLKNYILSACLYSSYNSILLIPVLIPLKQYIKGKAQIRKLSIISGGVILFLGINIFKVLQNFSPTIFTYEFPMLQIANSLSKHIKYFYGIIIFFATITSAISIGYSFLKNTFKEKSYKKATVLLCLTAIAVSKIGFAKLVGSLYPVFGIIGFIQLYYLFKKAIVI